jgi:BlaI family transcriptional regulator, penicillinase repressor
MPKPPPLSALTRRESQIMEILFRRGQATAAEVLSEMPDAPSYSTARKLLEILEEKGYVRHAQEGPRYVYSPLVAADDARNSALEQMVRTFFQGSIGSAVTALLELQGPQLSDEELDRIAKLAEQAKREGR